MFLVSGYRSIIIAVISLGAMLLAACAIAVIVVLIKKRRKILKKASENAALSLEKMVTSPSLKRSSSPFYELNDSTCVNPTAAYGVGLAMLHNHSNNCHAEYMSIRRSSPARSPMALRMAGHMPHAYQMVVCSDSDESHSVTV